MDHRHAAIAVLLGLGAYMLTRSGNANAYAADSAPAPADDSGSGGGWLDGNTWFSVAPSAPDTPAPTDDSYSAPTDTYTASDPIPPDPLMNQPAANIDANTAAFLQALRVGEGTKDAGGYTRLVGGGNFQSFATHPSENKGEFPAGGPRSFSAGGFYNAQFNSTAAGAYQITFTTWKGLRAKHADLTDFSPAAQDRAALYLIAEKGALADVQAGRVNTAVNKVRAVWESLPGSGTRPSNEVSMAQFDSYYTSNGGTLV